MLESLLPVGIEWTHNVIKRKLQTVEVSGILAKSVRVSHRKHHKKCLACLQQCGVAGFRLGQVAHIDRSALGELWFQYRKDLHSNFGMIWKTELVVQEVDSCLFSFRKYLWEENTLVRTNIVKLLCRLLRIFTKVEKWYVFWHAFIISCRGALQCLW